MLRPRATVHHDPPAAELPRSAPSPAGLAGEWRTAWQLPRLLAGAPRLRRAPRGRGAPVVLIPGWTAPELTMAPLRAYLQWLGHDARHWGFGANRGDVHHDVGRLGERVAGLADAAADPVALVGWSLGGVIAREVARTRPTAVRRVITYGTPAVGGPTYTAGVDAWGRDAARRIARETAERDRDDPLRIPITAIYSRRDRVVAWQSSIDRTSPEVEHVEVDATHFGLGLDPDVWSIVADRLAHDGGR